MKLVSLYSTITMMHGPINIRFASNIIWNDGFASLGITAACIPSSYISHHLVRVSRRGVGCTEGGSSKVNRDSLIVGLVPEGSPGYATGRNSS